jgi:hypothetical protein
LAILINALGQRITEQGQLTPDLGARSRGIQRHETSEGGCRYNCEGEDHGLSSESAASGWGAEGRLLRRSRVYGRDWQVLAEALRQLAANSEQSRQEISQHGEKYIIDGPITTPAGRMPSVRTVWIIDQGDNTPRLVTAYPHDEGE